MICPICKTEQDELVRDISYGPMCEHCRYLVQSERAKRGYRSRSGHRMKGKGAKKALKGSVRA